MSENQNLTIIIPYFNGREYIDALLKDIGTQIPVIIVDDLSDEPLTLNPQTENVKIIRPSSKGYFTGAVNVGIQACGTDVLILNQDSRLTNGWQSNLDPKYGLIGERIKGQNAAFPSGYIHGTFMYVKREVIAKVGLLNATLYPLWGSTAEYQLRVARSGYAVLPLTVVKGYNHLRGNKHYGTSIQETLDKGSAVEKRTLINTPPEVSVIIPVHSSAKNPYGRYLNEAVNCLIGGQTSMGLMQPQSFQSFEIIIVDDGSTDDTPDKIKELTANPYKGIRGLRIERKPVDKNGRYTGKPSALNQAIKVAHGKYITVLDVDDLMATNRLELMFQTIKQNPNMVIYDQLKSFANGEFTKDWTLPNYDFESIIYKNCMHIGIMYSKEAWLKSGGYPETMIYGREDWAFNVALGKHGFCGKKLEPFLYYYRREGANRTLVNTKNEWPLKFKEQMKGLYPELYKGVRPMACCGAGATARNRSSNRGQSFTESNLLMAGRSQNQDSEMVLVRYTGKRIGAFNIWGSTKPYTQYRVNPKAPIFYVYQNDLYRQGAMIGVLDYMENNHFVFELYSMPNVAPLPEVNQLFNIGNEEMELSNYEPEVEEDEPADPMVDVFESLVDEVSTGVDVSTLDTETILTTLATLQTFLDNQPYTVDDLNVLLVAEQKRPKPGGRGTSFNRGNRRI